MEPEKLHAREWREGAALIVSVGVMQAEAGDARRDIEACLALDTERLKGDGPPETADQHVGAETDADGGFGGSAAVRPCKGATLHSSRCEDRPGHVGFTGDANIDSQTGDSPDIDFGATTSGWMEAAAYFPGGTQNQADTSFDPTVKRADLDPASRFGRGSGGKGRSESESTCGYDPLFHDKVLFWFGDMKNVLVAAPVPRNFLSVNGVLLF
jgi:hypothetical protein